MRRPRPFLAVGRALRNLRGAPVPALVTAGTVAVATLLFAGLWMTATNARDALVGGAGRADHVTVFLHAGAPPGDVERIRSAVVADADVAGVRAIPPGEGLADLRRSLGDAGRALDGVDAASTIPAVIVVRLRPEALERAAAAAERFRALGGVESVESAVDWLERVRRLERVGGAIVLGWGGILAIGALLVVGNAARLAALLRREEIEVLRLVGASDAFVLAPFAIEGAIVGAVGAVLGIAAAAALHAGIVHGLGAAALAPFLIEIRFLEPVVLAALAVAGTSLGALGAFASARRFLRGVAL